MKIIKTVLNFITALGVILTMGFLGGLEVGKGSVVGLIIVVLVTIGSFALGQIVEER